MKTTISLTIDSKTHKKMIDTIGKGKFSSWVEEQEKQFLESKEMEKKVMPPMKGALSLDTYNSIFNHKKIMDGTLDIFCKVDKEDIKSEIVNILDSRRLIDIEDKMERCLMDIRYHKKELRKKN